MERAEGELLRRFPRTRLSLDRLLLDAMHDQADALKVSWRKVLDADGAPRESRDFQNLLRLVHHARPALERRLMGQAEPALLLHPGLLARYGLMTLLDDLRDAAGTKTGPPGFWLLIPQASAGLPTVDGKPVPVLSTTHWARLTESWMSNAHRAGARPAA